MKKNLLLFLILIFYTTNAYSQSWQWVKSGGSASSGGSDDDRAYSVALDSMGNSYVTGKVYTSPNFGSGSMTGYGGYDIFVAKYDCQGTQQWVKIHGGIYDDHARCIKADAMGNSYVFGAVAGNIATFGTTQYMMPQNSTFALTKFNTDGDLEWVKLGVDGVAGPERFEVIDIDQQGNIVITSYANVMTAGTDFYGSPLNRGNFMAKFNPTGDLLWAKNVDSIYYGGLIVTSLTTDYQNNIYVGGSFNDTIKINGIKYYPVGQDYSFLLTKYDPNGNLLWVKIGESLVGDHIDGVKVDNNGNIYICGIFTNPGIFGQDTLINSGTTIQANIFSGKLDSSGNFLWASSVTHNYNWSTLGLSLDQVGNTYITGQKLGSADFGNNVTLPAATTPDVFIASYDSTGSARWAWDLPATGSMDQGISTAINEKGDLCVAGMFSGTMQLGSYTVTSNGGISDIFVAKFGTSCSDPALLPPTAPVQLAVAASSAQSAIQLNWQDESGIEDGFRIYRSTAGGAWQLIDSVSANVATYLDANVQNNTLYCYRVAAYNHNGNSTFSNAECAELLTNIEDALAVQQLLLYPNPSSGHFTVSAQAKEATEAMLVISSITGQQVLQQRLNLQPGENHVPVILPGVAKGLYLVQAQSEGGVITRRLVIE